MSDDPTSRILAAIEGMRADLTAHMARIDRRQDDLTARMDRLGADLMARMDRLQDELTLRSEDATVNLGTVGRAERIAKAAQDEVRAFGDMVTAMARQIQRLQTEVRNLKGE
jgi:uncharacterized coiled-coil protein SlyX